MRKKVARKVPRRSAALAAAFLLGSAALAGAVVVQKQKLRVTVIGQVKPYRLPRGEPAPIAVFVSGHIAMADGTTPPQLTRMTIRVNRHGKLQSKGLPTCRISRIQPASTALALSRCRDALVGSGEFWAHIILPGQRPYPTSGRLLIFNGRSTCAGSSEPSCHPRSVIFAHIFSTRPFATSFVITFAIHRLRHGGAYGTELSASLPQALGNWGFVDRIKLTLRRQYVAGGQRRSFFNAACPAPASFDRATFSLFRTDFEFVGGRSLGLNLEKDCKVKS